MVNIMGKLDKIIPDGSLLKVYSSGNSSLGMVRMVGSSLTLNGASENVGIADGNDVVFLGPTHTFCGTGNTILNFGTSGDVFNFNIDGVTYNLNTGSFITTSQTGQYAPSGMTGQFVTTAHTGHIHSQYALVAGTGQFVDSSNTGNFVTNGMTGVYVNAFVRRNETGQYASSGMTGQFVTTAQTGHIHSQYALIVGTGQFISTAQTGQLLTTNYSGTTRFGGNMTVDGQLSIVNTLGLVAQYINEFNNANTINLTSAKLGNSDPSTSLDWANRLLQDQSSITTLAWHSKQLSGSWSAQALVISGSSPVLCSQTGQFAPAGMTGQFVTTAMTGVYVNAFPRRTETGQYAPAGMTGQFITTAQTGHIHSQYALVASTGQFISTAQTGQFAPAGMTGQFITTAITGNAFYPRYGNPDGFLTNATLTGGGVSQIIVTGTSISGNVTLVGSGNVLVFTGVPNTIIISGNTGNLVFRTETGHIHSQYALIVSTGQFITTAQTGQFAPSGLTGQFVTTAHTGHIHNQYALSVGTGQFISTAQTGQYAPAGMTGQFITTNKTGQFAPSGMTGQFVTTAQTGRFASYTDVVWVTGDQSISGTKTFVLPIYVSGRVATPIISPYDVLGVNSYPMIEVASGKLWIYNGSTAYLPTVDWPQCYLTAKNNVVSVNWNIYTLYDGTSQTALDWSNRILSDTSSVGSVDWQNRWLLNSSIQTNLDWENRQLSGNWDAEGLTIGGRPIVIGNTGTLAPSGMTGQFVTTNKTGQFAPSGMTGQFITTSQTGHIHSQYALSSMTGEFVTNQDTGTLAPAGKTGQFITTAQTGQYAPAGMTGQFVTTAHTGHIHSQYALVIGTGQFIDTSETGIFVARGETGAAFYPRYGNPAGYLISVGNVGVTSLIVTGVSLTGSVTISGAGGISVLTGYAGTNQIAISGWDTGEYVTTAMTGHIHSQYALVVGTGQFVTTAQTGHIHSQYALAASTGQFIDTSETGNFVTNDMTGVYVNAFPRRTETGQYAPAGMTGQFITTNKTGSFVTTGETRNLLFSGFTVINDLALLSPDQYGQNTITYPAIGAYETYSGLVTGALVFNTPIRRIDGRRVSFEVRGGDSSRGIDTTSWFRITSRLSGTLNGNIDGQPGAVASANLVALGDNIVQKSIGINKSGYLALVIGTTGYVQDWSRYKVDVWISDNYPIPVRTGWGWTIETGANYGFKDLSGLANSAPFVTGSASSFVMVDQTGQFVTTAQTGHIHSQYALVAGTGQFISTAQTGQYAPAGMTGQFVTTAMTGVYVNAFPRRTETGQYAPAGMTGQFVTTNKTGQYAPAGMTGQFVTTNKTGQYAPAGMTGQFVTTNKTGQYAPAGMTGQFVTTNKTGQYAPAGMTGQFITTNKTGQFISTAQTGRFAEYSRAVLITGNQSVGGVKSFTSDIEVNANYIASSQGTTGPQINISNTSLLLNQSPSEISLNWGARALNLGAGSSSRPTLDWSGYWLVTGSTYAETGVSLDWRYGRTNDIAGKTSIDWLNRKLSGAWDAESFTIGGQAVVFGNTGQFVDSSKTGNFVTNGMTGVYVNAFPRRTETGQYAPAGMTGQFVTTNKTGQFITTAKTGTFVTTNDSRQMTWGGGISLGPGAGTAYKLHVRSTDIAALGVENASLTTRGYILASDYTVRTQPSGLLNGAGVARYFGLSDSTAALQYAGAFGVQWLDATTKRMLMTFNVADGGANPTNGTERLVIDGTGHVGINILHPSVSLDVSGIIRSNSGIYINDIPVLTGLDGVSAGVNSVIYSGGGSLNGNVRFTGFNGIIVSGNTTDNMICINPERGVYDLKTGQLYGHFITAGGWVPRRIFNIHWASGETFRYISSGTGYGAFPTNMGKLIFVHTGVVDGKTITCSFTFTGCTYPTSNGEPIFSGEPRIYSGVHWEDTDLFGTPQFPGWLGLIQGTSSEAHTDVYEFTCIGKMVFGKRKIANAFMTNVIAL